MEDPDGVGHPRLEDIIGVHQQGGVVGVELAVGLKGGVLVGEHLDPGGAMVPVAGEPYHLVGHGRRPVPAQPAI